MSIYYVEATGSSTYPFDTREKAAVSFYELFNGHGIDELGPDDIVYVFGDIYEPNEWGFYPVNGTSVIGTDSRVDRINMSTAYFYGDSVNGSRFINLGIYTDEPDADWNTLIYYASYVEHCRFDGGNIAYSAIEFYDVANYTFIGNTFENFVNEPIKGYASSNYGDLVSLNQTVRAWQRMKSDGDGNLYIADSGTDNYLYERIGGVGDFLPISLSNRGWWTGVAPAPNGDLYATTNNFPSGGKVYKRTFGEAAFTEVYSSPHMGGWSDVVVAPNGSVYVVGGRIDLGQFIGIIYAAPGSDVFAPLNEPERGWTAVAAASDGSIYALTSSGVIYRRLNGTGSFDSYAAITISDTGLGGIAISPSGDIYVAMDAKVFKQTGGSGPFVNQGYTPRAYRGITIANENDLYVGHAVGSIYKRNLDYGDLIYINVVGNSFVTPEKRFLYMQLTKVAIGHVRVYNNAVSMGTGVAETLISILGSLVGEFSHSNNIVSSSPIYIKDEVTQDLDITEIVTDPQFLNTETDPLSIDTNSPCYAAGRTFIDDILTSDIKGTTYLNPPSIGAYEVGDPPEPAVADFLGSPLEGVAPFTVNFVDESTGAVSWGWDFGDGVTSTLQHPSHTYTRAGLYSVTLTINSGASSKTRVYYVIVTSHHFGSRKLTGIYVDLYDFTQMPEVDVEARLEALRAKGYAVRRSSCRCPYTISVPFSQVHVCNEPGGSLRLDDPTGRRIQIDKAHLTPADPSFPGPNIR